MKKSKRIGLSLFDDDVREMIESGMSIVPITQDMLDNNLNPNNVVYGRLDRGIYMWLGEHWDYIIADDVDINWIDIKGKPTSYVPGEHTHSDLHSHPNKSVLDTITQLLIDKWNTVTGKADKTYVDTELNKKSDTTHNHDSAYSGIGHEHNYSLPTHLHDDKYSQLVHLHNDTYYTETEVDAKLLLKSDTTHNHDGAYWSKTTPLPTGEKGDKPAHQWTGTSLAFENPNGSMGMSVNLKGETKDYIAGSNINIDGLTISAVDTDTVYTHPSTHPYSMLTGTPTIPSNTNQLTNGSGFITIADIPPATPGITVSASKPNNGSMWYKII